MSAFRPVATRRAFEEIATQIRAQLAEPRGALPASCTRPALPESGMEPLATTHPPLLSDRASRLGVSMACRHLVLIAAVLEGVIAPAAVRAQGLEIDLTQAPTAQAILPGSATAGWSYSGTVRSGPASALVPIPGSYLGPTIRVSKGQDLRMRLTNLIGEDSTTHRHGMDVPDDMDGHPRFAFPSGTTYEYYFPVLNRAGTYWYHPHPDMRTGGQVYAGLAGFLIVHDPEESSLNLPQGDFDLPLCMQDATFAASNRRVYDPNMMNGFFGATILVNGQLKVHVLQGKHPSMTDLSRG